ncbi:MAG: hypothetical protein HC767_12425 [Akkermansiaceae bacterium]|nr:hypothetical protein [Akkermansiaceae bacterium]
MTPLLGKEIEEPELISPPEIEDQISAEPEEEALPFAEKKENQSGRCR